MLLLTTLIDDTIQILLQHRIISVNAVYPLESKTTALHLAASLGRTDVVSLLLDQEGIDDTLRDANGHTALEVARSKEVQTVIQGLFWILTCRPFVLKI